MMAKQQDNKWGALKTRVAECSTALSEIGSRVSETNKLFSRLYGDIDVLAKEIQAKDEQIGALVTALTGHDDDTLWGIAWIETLMREYERTHDWENDEDPSATAEALEIGRRVCRQVRAAIKEATS